MKHQPWLTTSPLVLLLSALLLSACWGITAVITPLPTDTHTPTPTVMVTVTDEEPMSSPTATDTVTPIPTVTPSATSTATFTPTFTATSTATPTATHTPDDATPTRETGYVTATPERFTLANATYVYACADTRCTRSLLPAGAMYEIWDNGTTNEGWIGLAIAVGDSLYTTFWMQIVAYRQ